MRKRHRGSRCAPFVVAGALLALLATTARSLTGQARPGNRPAARPGTLERIRVHGAALEGNLSGDDPTRDVVVYLPPSYGAEPTRRYPAVYFLHGYSVGVEAYVRMTRLPGSADRAIAGGAQEMIVVLPDAYTVYSGSMYSSSPTTGDWESFVARDLVDYVDAHYRTIAEPGSRGLAGHSMGGYGTLRIGMKRPGVFAALYPMSSCCLLFDPSLEGVPEPGTAPPEPVEDGGFRNALFAQAAAWAPNPRNPPYFLDLPYDYVNGGLRPLVAAKWLANSPTLMADQYVPSLESYRAIAMEVGNEDPNLASMRQLSEQLTRLGIRHSLDVYEGNHTNRVGERMETSVLPFFSRQLDGGPMER